MKSAEQNLKDKLEQKVNPEFRTYLLVEMPKGEALLKLAEPESPEYEAVVSVLTKMYWTMNQQLGIVCKHLKYPLQQWEWKDSQPLEELAKIFKGIGATKWYQYHLGEMISPHPDHPWMKIMI